MELANDILVRISGTRDLVGVFFVCLFEVLYLTFVKGKLKKFMTSLF